MGIQNHYPTSLLPVLDSKDTTQNNRSHVEDAINKLIKIKGILCCMYIDRQYSVLSYIQVK